MSSLEDEIDRLVVAGMVKKIPVGLTTIVRKTRPEATSAKVRPETCGGGWLKGRAPSLSALDGTYE